MSLRTALVSTACLVLAEGWFLHTYTIQLRCVIFIFMILLFELTWQDPYNLDTKLMRWWSGWW